MKSYILKILLLALSIILFTGCSSHLEVEPISSNDYKNHNILFQANYNMSCKYTNPMGATLTLNIKEGSAFTVDNLENTYINGVGMTMRGAGLKLPENTLGLKGIKQSRGNSFWLLIYPNGNFISNEIAMLMGMGNRQKHVLWQGACTVHENQAPFNVITN